jgi:hypothetical protein
MTFGGLGDSEAADSDLIARGEQGLLEIRAMRLPGGSIPARDWYRSLNKKGIGQVKAVASIIETNYLSHRPAAGRASAVPRSRNNLIEIRVTPAGATAPHLRLFAVRRRMRLFAACGITKKSNKLRPQDIEAAERIADQWIEVEGA